MNANGNGDIEAADSSYEERLVSNRLAKGTAAYFVDGNRIDAQSACEHGTLLLERRRLLLDTISLVAQQHAQQSVSLNLQLFYLTSQAFV